MQSPDDKLYHNYDPVARREYYLKTRELKGRQPGANDLAGLARSSTALSTTRSHSKHKLQNATQRRHATEARLAELKNRLEKLQKVLHDLVQKTGGSNSSHNSADKKKHRAPSKLTAKQRHEAAKRSKEYRKKHPPSEQIKLISAKIEAIKVKIAKLRAEAKIPEKKPHKKSELHQESLASLPTKK